MLRSKIRYHALEYLPLRGRYGFTLSELVIATALLAILSGVLASGLLLGRRTYVTSETYVQVQEETRRAFDAMGRELRGGGGTITPAANQLTFQLALGFNLAPLAGCPANAICWGAKNQAGANQPGWTLRYRLDTAAQQLLREVVDNQLPTPAVQSTRVLANSIQTVSFSYAAATQTITIQLQAQRASQELPGGSLSAAPTPLVTRVRLRNQ